MGDRIERACRVCSSLLHHEDRCEAAETREEQFSRLRAMANDDGTTWDLSPYDQAAIAAVLAERDAGAVSGPCERCGLVPGWRRDVEREVSWQERAEMMEVERDAARLQADEWKRYAEALDAGVGSTMEEQRDEARALVRRLADKVWALGPNARGGFVYDEAQAAIRRWDAATKPACEHRDRLLRELEEVLCAERLSNDA